jgi:inhibitor of KinA sporulation pathway (predicted exonuclease)
MDKLQSGRSFKAVYNDFVKFGDSESILCVWGMSDLKELFRNVAFHTLDSSVISKEYINIQKIASKYLQCPKGTNVGLKNAVELLEIPLKDEFHDAFNDAYYTVEVFKKIYNNKIKTSKYNINKALRPKHSNNTNKIDTYNLIKQFEKMYNREMSEEEKSIIKLAYIMGKTNQFQIKDLDKSELEK